MRCMQREGVQWRKRTGDLGVDEPISESREGTSGTQR
jgi:hypothetical protein